MVKIGSRVDGQLSEDLQQRRCGLLSDVNYLVRSAPVKIIVVDQAAELRGGQIRLSLWIAPGFRVRC